MTSLVVSVPLQDKCQTDVSYPTPKCEHKERATCASPGTVNSCCAVPAIAWIGGWSLHKRQQY
eukprot:2549294-Amphidinium_carterae.1